MLELGRGQPDYPYALGGSDIDFLGEPDPVEVVPFVTRSTAGPRSEGCLMQLLV